MSIHQLMGRIDPATGVQFTAGREGFWWRVVAEWRVNGDPKAQPRGRAFAMNFCSNGHAFKASSKSCPKCGASGFPRAMIHEAGTAESWKGAVGFSGAVHKPPEPLDGPVRADVSLYLRRPKALMRKRDPDGPILCIKKPDRDNADKAILDALKQLGWFRDDAQVCGGEVEKYYHGKTDTPHAWIRISVPR